MSNKVTGSIKILSKPGYSKILFTKKYIKPFCLLFNMLAYINLFGYFHISKKVSPLLA